MIENTSFINNTAFIEGGAIKWNLYEPKLKNVMLLQNVAGIYGNDVASVAKYLIPIDKSLIGDTTISSALNL